MFMILEKVNKCQFIMEIRVKILLLCHLHFVHKYHKHQGQVINIELKVKIELQSLSSEKVLHQKEIFIQR